MPFSQLHYVHLDLLLSFQSNVFTNFVHCVIMLINKLQINTIFKYYIKYTIHYVLRRFYLIIIISITLSDELLSGEKLDL